MSDATRDPSATLPAGDAPVVAARLAGRYVVGELIGRGGAGQVHRAADTLTGGEVAVKFVRALTGAARRQLRRELTALRLLDLPGVVRLLDDGEEGDETFLVMELLPGGPVSGLAGPYERWAPAARVLVETLARVHHAGVIHRDLKPANVLLDAASRPVITDFGLARGEAVAATGGAREGTPRYVAPEQWAGRPCDERSDLYALGAVLWELLVGERFPHGGAGRERVLAADGPEALRRTILRLLEPDPRERPESAEEVLEAIGGGDAVLGPLPALPDPVPREALEALVDEPRPTFHHLAEDAATLLLERSGADLARIRATLASWIRAGRCHWHGGRLRIDRAALSALRWEGTIGLRGTDAEVADSALAASDAAWDAGDPGRALAVLEAVLPLLADAERARHRHAARVLSLNDPHALRRALYLAERAGDGPLVALLQGARLCGSQEMARAAELLERLAPLGDELEAWRIAWWSHALGRLDRAAQAALLDRVEAWCRADPVREARWLGWRGLARYGDGDYAGALADQEASAGRLRDHPVERLAALVNAAAAALESASLDRAQALADEARELGRALRHPFAESAATLLLRSARYRAGLADEPRPELVDAAARVAPAQEAQHALTEATIAWRAGRAAAELALRAADLYARLGHRGRALALGLAASAGADVDPEELVALAAACSDPTLALQAVALGAPRRAAGLPLEDWFAAWPLRDPRACADVLSLAECRQKLQ